MEHITPAKMIGETADGTLYVDPTKTWGWRPPEIPHPPARTAAVTFA